MARLFPEPHQHHVVAVLEVRGAEAHTRLRSVSSS